MLSSFGMIRTLEISFNSRTTHKPCPTTYKRAYRQERLYIIIFWKYGSPIDNKKERSQSEDKEKVTIWLNPTLYESDVIKMSR